MTDHENPPPAEAPAEAPAPETAEAPAAAPAAPALDPPSNPAKKRKVAVFLSYVGHGYAGMQRNPGVKTIEEDLFKAIHLAGGISDANADDKGFQKIHFMRAARTDKGVSAVGQVVSLMMVVHPEGVIDRINANLPPAIRCYGYRRVVKGFDARKACDKRRYEYILPAWMFDTEMKGIYIPKVKKSADGGDGNGGAAVSGAEGDEKVADMGDDADCDAAAELAAEEADEAAQPQPEGGDADAAAPDADAPPYGSNSTFVFDDECKERMTKILKQYEGTHNFHNYTIKVAASAPQAKRYILSFTCDGTFEIDGKPWVRLVVIGQSFMLHQIRKMVGMALAEFRGDAPAGCLKYALGSPGTVITPMAPDLGLFLDECYYEAYNERWGALHEPLALGDWSSEVASFKAERLYPALAARDVAERVNAGWLKGLTSNMYKFNTWLQRPDAKGIAGAGRGGGGGRGGRGGRGGGGSRGGRGRGGGGEDNKRKSGGESGASGEAKRARQSIPASLQAEYSD